jgi:hypothetical protein
MMDLPAQFIGHIIVPMHSKNQLIEETDSK